MTIIQSDGQMPRNSRRLTALQVKNWPADPAKRQEISDGGSGLNLVVYPSGRKSWAVRYRRKSDGRTRKLILDGFAPLAKARELAATALAKVADGGDPAADKQSSKREAKVAAVAAEQDTVDALFRDFLDKHKRRRDDQPIRESTKVETARLLGLRRDQSHPSGWAETGAGVLAKWKGRPVTSIAKRDVVDLLDEIAKRAPIAANRTRAELASCFRWLMKRDDTLPRSPLDGVEDPSPEISRDRVLADAELAALWRAAEDDVSLFGSMVQLLILTACRRDEVRDAEWQEFDVGNRQWLIPSRRVKNGRDHLVPISGAALAVLSKLPRIKGSTLLFTTTGETPISGLSKAKLRLHDAMARELGHEPASWTLHDLRRTATTGLQRLGFPLEVTEAVLNHRSGKLSGVAGVYARHDYLGEKRRALDAWAAHVMAIVFGEPAASNGGSPSFREGVASERA